MPVPTVSPKALADKLALPESQRPVLFDVRSPEEHAYVSLPNSMLVPLPELEAPEHREALEDLKGREVVVYCHHGIRSLSGAAFLCALGIDAKSLTGGIERYALEVDASLRRY